MKNVLCPISNERIPEHLPRITAFINIGFIIAFIVTHSLFIAVFLSFDYLLRGFNFSKASMVHWLAKRIGIFFRFKSPLIDKAPKLFAARLGGFMFFVVSIFMVFNLLKAGVILAIFVAVLSTLECVFSFCVGCHMYQYLVFPFYSKSTKS